MPETPRYPLSLSLDGRAVLVVGGGRVATRRLPLLIRAGARVRVVAPQVSDDIARSAASVQRRPYASGDLDSVWLVHACTNDPAVNAAVAADAEARGVWCVRADDGAASAAWTPASGSVDEVSVAVTAGRDPRRSRAIRDAVLSALRDGSLPARRRREGVGKVVLVGGGPGAPDLLTLRGRRALHGADVVVCDRLGPRELLDELADDVEVIDVGKTPRGPAAAQEEINRLLVEHARAGRCVVRLKGGDPFVFGRGGEEVLACVRAGVPVEVIPGVSSATGVPTLAGVPLTHRGLAQEFTVVAGHLPPGHPGSEVDWAAHARGRGTLVLLMAVDNLAAIAAELLAGGRAGATPVAVVADGSLPTQRVLHTTLAEAAAALAAAGLRAPAVTVIGPAAAALQAGEAG